MRFSWRNKLGFFELNPFPGCNQIVVSNHAFIRKDMRGNGLGQEQHADRLYMAADYGYDYIICTVNAGNEAEKHILKKNNWYHLDTFDNRETGNSVEIWGRQLNRS